MDNPTLSQWLGGAYVVTLKNPPGYRVSGILRELVPEQYITLHDGKLNPI